MWNEGVEEEILNDLELTDPVLPKLIPSLTLYHYIHRLCQDGF